VARDYIRTELREPAAEMGQLPICSHSPCDKLESGDLLAAGVAMNESSGTSNLVDVDTSVPVWDQFFTVAPLVLIGTIDKDGSLDLAPKHMVTPMGWQNYFGFV